MKARKWWISAGSAVMLLFVAWKCHWFSSEPTHKGKTVTEWLDVFSGSGLKELSNRDGGRGNNDALAAIQAIGTNSIPILLRHLDKKPGRLSLTRERVREAFGSFGVKLLGSVEEVDPEALELGLRRYAASSALLALGASDGTDAARLFAWGSSNRIPEIYPTIEAFRVALPTTPKLREDLITRLQDTDAGVRRFALQILVYSGGEMKLAFPIVTNLLADTDHEVSYFAVFATRSTGREQPEIAVPILSQVLTNATAPNQRHAAASVLADFGTNALTSISALETATSDSDPHVAKKAKDTLSRIRKAAGLAGGVTSR